MSIISSLPPGVLLILGAVVLPLLLRRWRAIGFLAFPILTFFYLLYLKPGMGLTFPFLSYELVPLRVDRLSLCFGYVFALITFLGGVYAFHIKDIGEQICALLYAGSSLGVVFAGDLFTLYFFWEIMAISSVYLIWARRTPQSVKSGMRYILVHLFGGAMLLFGILWHVTDTGSILFNPLEEGLAAYLILFGFCLSAAVPPIHAWLSDAYPEGTVTGSVFLSAFTTKTAVYTLARGFAGWDILIWAGAIMAAYGVIFAAIENDTRRVLSYHIISQVGYMVCGVGLGTEVAINGATAHAFCHILYKALLFMGAGTVLYATGRSKLTELGGLARAMPLALALYMVGAFSISGFPLFNGFVSKSMVIYAAELSHMDLVYLLLNMASVGTFLCLGLKLPYFTWFGLKRDLKPTPIPLGMYIGMALTSIICFVIGVYPALLYNILPYPVAYQPYTASHLFKTFQLLMFTGLGFWLFIKKLGGEATITLDTDWFYRRPSRLTYKVFVVSLSRLFGVIENLVFRLTYYMVRWSMNPIGYLFAADRLRRSRPAKQLIPPTYDPDRYRFSVGVIILVLLVCLIILIAWSLLGLH